MYIRRFFPIVYRQDSLLPDLLFGIEESLNDPAAAAIDVVVRRFKDGSAVSIGSPTKAVEDITSSVDAISGETTYCYQVRVSGFTLASLAVGMYLVQVTVADEYFPSRGLTLEVRA